MRRRARGERGALGRTVTAYSTLACAPVGDLSKYACLTIRRETSANPTSISHGTRGEGVSAHGSSLTVRPRATTGRCGSCTRGPTSRLCSHIRHDDGRVSRERLATRCAHKDEPRAGTRWPWSVRAAPSWPRSFVVIWFISTTWGRQGEGWGNKAKDRGPSLGTHATHRELVLVCQLDERLCHPIQQPRADAEVAVVVAKVERDRVDHDQFDLHSSSTQGLVRGSYRRLGPGRRTVGWATTMLSSKLRRATCSRWSWTRK